MLPKCDVIIVLLCMIICGWHIRDAQAIAHMSQCEFVHEFMKYSPQISRDDLNKWTCIAHYQSNFDVTKRFVGIDGSTSYGLFQISDQLWCSRTASDKRACDLPCTKLEDKYFGDDFQCVQKIFQQHLLIYGNGFGGWPVYGVHCTSPKDYASECLDRKGSYKSTSLSSTAVHRGRVKYGNAIDDSAVPKVYERCELARELFYVHDLPAEQIATWVCIARYESEYKTSAVNYGSGDHGLFQISQLFWCDKAGSGCDIPCAKLEDNDISDDVQCIRRIHDEHKRLSGDGFNAWAVYPRCKQTVEQFIDGCFDGGLPTPIVTVPKPAIFAPIPVSKPIGKRYDRCELARELRFRYNLPRDQIHTWVCIAKHESSFDTSAVGRLNADGSGDHGLFQISDIYWCSVDGSMKACGVPCSKFEDSDISDDVQCVQRIHAEHQSLFGNGFHAWTVYEPHCKHQTVDYIRDCFEGETDVSNTIPQSPGSIFSSAIRTPPVHKSSPGKKYDRCELARELRHKHNVPMDQIHTWVCIAQQLSGLDTSSVVSGSYGLFHIGEQYWCDSNSAGKGCSVRCSDLTDGDIADDVRCVQTIHNEHQRLSGNGFNAWTPYETRCKYETVQSVQDCFHGQPSFNLHTALVPVKVVTVPQVVGQGKVYERCELAKELRYKHNVPRDQIADWVCVALYHSNFATSKVGPTQTEFGLFQINNEYWCSSTGGGTKGCNLNCAQLTDNFIGDDIACARVIHAEHQRLFGNGFNAWAAYEPYCKGGKSAQYIQNCFTDDLSPLFPAQKIAPVISKPSAAISSQKKVYDRCELARELRFKYNMPRDQIHTWVCIAKHESSFDTSAVGRLNADGSGDHGLFQISDIYWCSVDGSAKACGVPCWKFEDPDISDDVQCVQRIHEEHQRLFGNGFHAWTVYEPHCRHQTVDSIRDCFEGETDVSNAVIPVVVTAKSILPVLPVQEGKAYQRCELASELRHRHNVPIDQIADWVCIAQYQSNLVTSTRGQTEHGIFQISNTWCSYDGAAKGCNINCAKLEDADIQDDVACARHIQKTQGFTAWDTYEPFCRGRSVDLVRDCFHDVNLASAVTSSISPITLKRPSILAAPRPGKVYTQCDLANELRFVHNVPLNQIHTWVCIAQQQSHLNTSAIEAPQAIGYRGFGIFGINEAVWCAGDGDSANLCGLSCLQFLDHNLADDVQCAQRIHNEHQQLYGNGFQAWNSYEANCKYQTAGEIKHCFAQSSVVTATQAPIAAAIAQSYAPMKRVYDRCTLARDFHFRQNIALDKLTTWLCIAEFEPTFDESNIVAMNRIYESQQRLTGNGFESWQAYHSHCKHRVHPSVDQCFVGSIAATMPSAPLTAMIPSAPLTAATISRVTTKSAAQKLFDLYLNQYSTRKPTPYIIPTISNASPGYRRFEITTPSTKTSTLANDYFRNFVNTQITKLVGSYSNPHAVVVPSKTHTATSSPFSWTANAQKTTNVTVTKPFEWSVKTTTNKPPQLSRATTRKFEWNTTNWKSTTTKTTATSTKTTTTTTTTRKPFQWTTRSPTTYSPPKVYRFSFSGTTKPPPAKSTF